MVDTSREAREKRQAKVGGWFAWGLVAAAVLAAVVAYNLPPPSPEELARRALAEEQRQQERAVEIQNKKVALASCLAVVRTYDRYFDAYVDAEGRVRSFGSVHPSTGNLEDSAGWFQLHK